eukprot:2548964-Prymnesium_polylepis.1
MRSRLGPAEHRPGPQGPGRRRLPAALTPFCAHPAHLWVVWHLRALDQPSPVEEPLRHRYRATRARQPAPSGRRSGPAAASRGRFSGLESPIVRKEHKDPLHADGCYVTLVKGRM